MFNSPYYEAKSILQSHNKESRKERKKYKGCRRKRIQRGKKWFKDMMDGESINTLQEGSQFHTLQSSLRSN